MAYTPPKRHHTVYFSDDEYEQLRQLKKLNHRLSLSEIIRRAVQLLYDHENEVKGNDETN